MADRMTKERLRDREANVNRRLEARGSRYRWRVEHRNGGVALDRVRASDGSTVDLITAGTSREVGDYLYAAMVALDDATIPSTTEA